MSGHFVAWQISEDRTQIIGPCGHALPNTFDGIMQARDHDCEG